MTFSKLRDKDATLGAIAPEAPNLIPDAVIGDPLAVSASVLSHLVTSYTAHLN
jgi:hypothetical protein